MLPATENLGKGKILPLIVKSELISSSYFALLEKTKSPS